MIYIIYKISVSLKITHATQMKFWITFFNHFFLVIEFDWKHQWEIVILCLTVWFFDFVHLLYYKCHKVNSSRGGSYIDSPEWLKNKKAIINPINKKFFNDNKCFQYAGKAALNHEKIRKNPKRKTKFKSFINKYDWEGINSPSKKDDWKNF